jgi:hypothetical protein
LALGHLGSNSKYATQLARRRALVFGRSAALAFWPAVHPRPQRHTLPAVLQRPSLALGLRGWLRVFQSPEKSGLRFSKKALQASLAAGACSKR